MWKNQNINSVFDLQLTHKNAEQEQDQETMIQHASSKTSKSTFQFQLDQLIIADLISLAQDIMTIWFNHIIRNWRDPKWAWTLEKDISLELLILLTQVQEAIKIKHFATRIRLHDLVSAQAPGKRTILRDLKQKYTALQDQAAIKSQFK